MSYTSQSYQMETRNTNVLDLLQLLMNPFLCLKHTHTHTPHWLCVCKDSTSYVHFQCNRTELQVRAFFPHFFFFCEFISPQRSFVAVLLQKWCPAPGLQTADTQLISQIYECQSKQQNENNWGNV